MLIEDEKIDLVAGLMKAMAHPLRLRILCLLLDGEKSVGQLQEEVKTTNANVSQHLTILRHQGIVAGRRDANCIYNRIGDDRITELLRALRRLFC